jgi:signal peptidase I
MNGPADPAPKIGSSGPSAGDLSELRVSRGRRMAANLKTVIGAVLLALVIRTALFEEFEIEGPSMEPTLLSGDRVVVSKFSYGLFLPLRDHAEMSWASPQVGNVVVINSPADGADIVKRVIGVSGDFVEMRGDRVYRNGQPLPLAEVGPCRAGVGQLQPDCRVYESKAADHAFLLSSARAMPEPMPTRVPEGHVYVLGDHRDLSNDSRNPKLGAIPINRIKGRAVAIYWSHGPDGLLWHRMFQAVR